MIKLDKQLLNIITKNHSWETITKKMLQKLRESTLARKIYICSIDKTCKNIIKDTEYKFITDIKYKIKDYTYIELRNITINNKSYKFCKFINLYDLYYLIICSEEKVKVKKSNITTVFSIIIKHLLRERELIEKRDIIVANISHDLRTPLNSIMGYVDILLNDLQLQNEEYRITEKIKKNSNILLQLINNIIDMSKIQNNKMEIRCEPCNIKKIIKESIQIASSDNINNIPIYKEISPNIPKMILTDSTRLCQILVNLINNAFKFTLEGYVKIYIEVKDGYYFSESTNSDDQSNSLVNENKGKGMNLQFIIEDTGIGIKDDDINKLYKTFSRLNSIIGQKIKGNGLGLSIVKNLVDLMDGVIDIESEFGKGTKFIFHIPVYEYTNYKYKIDNRILNGCKVLFISKSDDNEICRILNIFEKHEIIYDCRTSMRLGIQTGIKNPKYKFDIIVLTSDVRDMDYEEFVNIVKNHKDIPIIYMTNNAEQSVFDRNLHLPCNKEEVLHYIYKLTYSKRKKRKSFKTKTPRIKIGRNSKLITNYESNILIVDDNDENLKMLKETLPYLGYNNIDIAHGGKEAYKMVKSSIKTKKKNNNYSGMCKYKIIFMDLLMPDMNGIDTSIKIKNLFSRKVYSPMIVALTANILENDMKQCKKYMDGYIRKPFHRQELIKYLSMI